MRYNKYANILISEYILYFNSVVTPLEKRCEIHNETFKEDFQLSDMCDLYKSSILLRDRFYTPVIELFYTVEEQLTGYFLRMIEEIVFEYSKELEEILSTFLNESKRLDVRRSILESLQLQAGGKTESESIAEELKKSKRDYVTGYINGNLKSHMMTSVVGLYFYMGFQKEYIEKYLNEAKRLQQKLEDISVEENRN